MKKILFLPVITLTFLAYSCSSNNNGVSNPNKTDKEFENPSGELTSSNAKAIVNGGIAANTSLILRNPETIFGDGGLEFDACTETSGDTTTIDWDCVFNNVVQCDATGQTIEIDDADKDFVNLNYANFTNTCNNNTPDEVFIEVDGEFNISRLGTNSNPIFCADITFTVNDVRKTFDGCRNSNGYISVRLDDKNLVILEMDINESCTQITTTIRDKDGTDDVVCDIQQTDGSCDGPGNIEVIGNCQI